MTLKTSRLGPPILVLCKRIRYGGLGIAMVVVLLKLDLKTIKIG